MSFIRPEAQAVIHQWRGVWQGAAIVALGLWFAVGFFGVLSWLGWVLCLPGLALMWTGWLRARIRPRTGGQGVVEIDERQVTWLTGEGGTRFSLDDVVRIDIETNDRGPFEDDMFWIFTLHDGSRHEVSGGAADGESIFDALSAFSGVNFENVIRASSSTDNARFAIWQKGD